MGSNEDEICEEYRASLEDLTTNSKPLINMLTMLSEENLQFAPQILKVIKNQLLEVEAAYKMPILYLIDSIIKNVREPYLKHITSSIVMLFCHVFQQVDEKTRLLLYKLRQTWNDVFPQKLLYNLDISIRSLDPAWPITAHVEKIQKDESQNDLHSNIHINPKFLSKASSPPNDLSTPAKSPDEETYRQILIAKKRDLLKLQQQKLEIEIAQTKLKLLNSSKGSSVKERLTQDPRLGKNEQEESLDDSLPNIKRSHIDKDERSFIQNNKLGKRFKRKPLTDDDNKKDIDYRSASTEFREFNLIPIDDDKKKVTIKDDMRLPPPPSPSSPNLQKSVKNLELLIASLIKEASSHGHKGLLGPEKQAQILKSAANLLETGRLTSYQHKTLMHRLQEIFDLFNHPHPHRLSPHSPSLRIPYRDRYSIGAAGHQHNKYDNNKKQQQQPPNKFTFKRGQSSTNEQETARDNADHESISPSIISPQAIPDIHKVLIDGVEREIHFHAYTGLVLLPDGLPHVISFKLGGGGGELGKPPVSVDTEKSAAHHNYRFVLIDDILREKLYTNFDTVVYLNGHRHTFRLGAPSRELFVDGRPYQINFTPPGAAPASASLLEETNILLGGKAHSVKLIGPSPEVDINGNSFFDLNTITAVNEEVTTCEHCQLYLRTYFESNKSNVTNLNLPQLESSMINNNSTNTNLPLPPPFLSAFGNNYFHHAAAAVAQQTYANHLSSSNFYQNILPPPPFGLNLNQSRYPVVLPPLTTNQVVMLNQSQLSFSTNPSLPPFSMPVPVHGNLSLPPFVGGNNQSLGYSDDKNRSNLVPKNEEDSYSPSQTTEDAGIVDVNNILSNLIKSGIINPQLQANDEGDEPEVELKLPDIDISDSEALKIKYDGVMNQLYAGFQCSSCGLRFWNDDLDLQNKKYAAHLDWHFRQNRKLKESGGLHMTSKLTSNSSSTSSNKSTSTSFSKKLSMRAWYYTIEDWCQLQEICDDIESSGATISTVGADKIKSDLFETQKKEAYESRQLAFLSRDSLETICRPSDESHYNEYQTKESLKLLSSLQEKLLLDQEAKNEEQVAAKFESFPIAKENDICELCNEPFEQTWDEDREEWILKDAIQIKETNLLYHPTCWQETDVVNDISLNLPFTEDEEKETLIGNTNIINSLPSAAPPTSLQVVDQEMEINKEFTGREDKVLVMVEEKASFIGKNDYFDFNPKNILTNKNGESVDVDSVVAASAVVKSEFNGED